MAIVRELRRREVDHAADQNAGKRSERDGARRKALGMAAGEPDLRLYFPGGRLVLVELKRQKGVLSPAQKIRIPALRALGFTVHVLKARTPAEAVDKITTIIDGELR